MTLAQAKDEVKSSLDQMKVTLNLDDQQIRTQVNWARRDMCIRLLPYKQSWFLITGQAFTDGDTLQSNVIGSRLKRVLVSGKEIRYAKPAEFFKNPLSTINPAIAAQPIYTLWKNNIYTFPTGLTGTYDFYQGLTDLATDGTADSTDIGMPHGYEVGVTLGAIYRCLYKLNQKDKLTQAYQDCQSVMASLEDTPQKEMKTDRIRSESLPMPQ